MNGWRSTTAPALNLLAGTCAKLLTKTFLPFAGLPATAYATATIVPSPWDGEPRSITPRM